TYLNNTGLAANTDIFLTADHGFGTISRHDLDTNGTATTSYAATNSYPGVNPGFLPTGFVAIDLAHFLNLPLYDPDTTIKDGSGTPISYAVVDPTKGQRPTSGDGLIGGTGQILATPNAKVVVAANGGSDLIYIPDGDVDTLDSLVDFLSNQDYVSGIFVAEKY